MSRLILMCLLIGFAGAAAIAIAARRLRVLTIDGAIAAAIVGAIVFGIGGWPMAALLLIFFLTSSLLTRLGAGRKFHPEHKQGRSAGQVLANGAVASAFAIFYGLDYSSAAASGFAAAVAASTADTWATEVGLLSTVRPRLITTWREVPPGSSGAVTWLGTLAGIIGAAVISAAAFYWLGTPVLFIVGAGVIAMFVDSILGATAEGRIRWIDNNVVNFIATAAGAALGYATATLA